MAEFIRARSAEQKEQRLEQIKGAVRRQFAARPYHQITLTTIAEELGWSRANLYKYVSTKEEVFLLLAEDEMGAYFEALLAALPEGCGLAAPTIAEVWAGIANAHREYFRLGDLLPTIVETNVGLERLKDFKRGYYDYVERMSGRLAQILPMSAEDASWAISATYYHAVGITGYCWSNPLVTQALDELGISPYAPDFRAEMADFIGMCLARRAQA